MSFFEVHLDNFRCYDKASFRFYSGCNLLHGKSGSGKSTITEAIFFALFGTLKNVQGKNGKETNVTIVCKTLTQSFRIIRSRPANLVVEVENKKYTHTTAQSWIYNFFGTPDIWCASSYLSQGNRQYLMSASNAEKTQLLEKLTFGESDSPEQYLLVLKEHYHQVQNKLSKEIMIKQVHDKMVQDFYEKYSNDLHVQDFFDLSDTEEKYKNLGLKILKMEELFPQVELAIRLKAEKEALQIPSFTVIEEDQLKNLQRYSEYLCLHSEFSNIECHCIEVPKKKIEETLELYSLYKEAGYIQGTSIISFLKEAKEYYLEYSENLQKKSTFIENSKLQRLNSDISKKYEEDFEKYQAYEQKKNRIRHLLLPNEEDHDFYQRIYKCYLENNPFYRDYLKNGWKCSTKIETFIDFYLEQNKKYEDWLQQELKNQEIEKRNSEKEKSNFQKEQEYILAQEKHKKYQQKIQCCTEKIANNTISILYEGDDGSKETLMIWMKEYERDLQELICPHCSQGVSYNKGVLEKGHCNLENRQRKEMLFTKCKEEYSKRIEYYTAIHDFSKIQEIQEPHEPLYQSLETYEKIPKIKASPLQYYKIPSISYEEIGLFDEYIHQTYKKFSPKPSEPILYSVQNILYKEMSVPRLSTFTVPEYSFEDCLIYLQIYSSRKKYSKYQELRQDFLEFKEDLKSVNLKIQKLLKLQKEHHSQTEKKKFYEEQCQSLPEIDYSLKDKILQCHLEKSSLKKQIYSFNKLKEYQELQENVKNSEKNILSLSDESASLQECISLVTEISTQYLNETIDSLNVYLKILCDELFENPISVALKSHRILKNGDEKKEISFEIAYNFMNFDTIRMLSGGENDRISFALLLAFSRFHNSPIIILDEICSSLDVESREKVVDLLRKWTDKIVIHILHDANMGIHDYVINLDETAV